MQKKVTITKAFLHSVKKLFRSRNLIIISDHKVDHVPLSGVVQVLLLTGFVGFFSGMSYLVGSYVTASSAISEKDKKIVTSTLEKTRVNAEITALKRDLVRLNENGNELTAYSKFLISQHNDFLSPMSGSASVASSPVMDGGLLGQNTAQLLGRISFLESRVNEIKSENIHLVTAIRERTDKKINYLDDIISMTGLDADNMERMAESEKTSGKKIHGSLKVNTSPDEDAKKDSNIRGANEGGPFIPYYDTSFNSTEQSLLSDVDRLIVLNSIVGTLPLGQPINDAQQMSPFGKRVDPLNHRMSMHPGLDLAGPIGSKVFSTNNGVVIAAGRKPAYGNMIDVEHRFGIVTRYAHMSRILVHEGDHVIKGQQIGVQGSTGRSTGPHLHYEVRINERPVNPINFLHAGQYVFEE